MVYNIKSKVLDLGNMQASSYKHNKMIHMPEPESNDLETLHEFRRTEMRRIFNRAVKSKLDSSNCKSGSKSPECKGHSNIPSYESNLSEQEILGLKSLKEKIKDGQLVIAQTDKSKRFSALTREQYYESGAQHTANDIEISQSQVK